MGPASSDSPVGTTQMNPPAMLAQPSAAAHHRSGARRLQRGGGKSGGGKSGGGKSGGSQSTTGTGQQQSTQQGGSGNGAGQQAKPQSGGSNSSSNSSSSSSNSSNSKSRTPDHLVSQQARDAVVDDDNFAAVMGSTMLSSSKNEFPYHARLDAGLARYSSQLLAKFKWVVLQGMQRMARGDLSSQLPFQSGYFVHNFGSNDSASQTQQSLTNPPPASSWWVSPAWDRSKNDAVFNRWVDWLASIESLIAQSQTRRYGMPGGDPSRDISGVGFVMPDGRNVMIRYEGTPTGGEYRLRSNLHTQGEFTLVWPYNTSSGQVNYSRVTVWKKNLTDTAWYQGATKEGAGWGEPAKAYGSDASTIMYRAPVYGSCGGPGCLQGVVFCEGLLTSLSAFAKQDSVGEEYAFVQGTWLQDSGRGNPEQTKPHIDSVGEMPLADRLIYDANDPHALLASSSENVATGASSGLLAANEVPASFDSKDGSTAISMRMSAMTQIRKSFGDSFDIRRWGSATAPYAHQLFWSVNDKGFLMPFSTVLINPADDVMWILVTVCAARQIASTYI